MPNLLVWNIQQLSTPKIDRVQFAEYIREMLGGGAFSAVMILELTRDDEKAIDVVNWFKDVFETLSGGDEWKYKISDALAVGRRGDRCAFLYHKNYIDDLEVKELSDSERQSFADYRVPAVFKGMRGDEELYFVGYHGPSPTAKKTIRKEMLGHLADLEVLDKPNVVVAGDFNLDYGEKTYDVFTKRDNNPLVNTRLDPTLGTTLKVSVPSWSNQITTKHAYDQVFVPHQKGIFSDAKSGVLTQLVDSLIGREFAVQPDDGSLDEQLFLLREREQESDHLVNPSPEGEDLESGEEEDEEDNPESEDDGGLMAMDLESDPEQEKRLISSKNDAVWFFRKISDHLPVLLLENGSDLDLSRGQRNRNAVSANEDATSKRRKQDEKIIKDTALGTPVPQFSDIPIQDNVTRNQITQPAYQNIHERAAQTMTEQTSAATVLVRFTTTDLVGLTDRAKFNFYVQELIQESRENFALTGLVDISNVEVEQNGKISDSPGSNPDRKRKR